MDKLQLIFSNKMININKWNIQWWLKSYLAKKSIGWKKLYDNLIFAIDDFLTNWIKVLHHRWQKCVNHKENYVEN